MTNADRSQLFIEALALDKQTAAILIEEGFESIEAIAYVPIEELLRIAHLSEVAVRAMRERAKDYLLEQELAKARQSPRP